MTDEQRLAHERLLARLPVHTVAEKWNQTPREPEPAVNCSTTRQNQTRRAVCLPQRSESSQPQQAGGNANEVHGVARDRRFRTW